MAGYIGNVPVPQATQTRDVFTATSGQTSFATSGYTPGFLDVFLNGVKLVNGTDFTASNGSDVVLSSGATLNDTVEVISYATFELADQSFSGNFSVDSPTFVVKADSDRVGINTTNPQTSLHVIGGVRARGGAPGVNGVNNNGFSFGSPGDNDGGMYSSEDGQIEFYTNSLERMKIDSTGKTTVNGNLEVPNRGLFVNSREQFNLTNLGDEFNIDWNNVTHNSISYALGSAHTNAPLNQVNSLVVDLNTEGMGGSDNSGANTRGVQMWFTDTPGSQDGGIQGRFAIRPKQGATWHPWEKVLTTYSFRRNIVRQSGSFLTTSGTFQNIGVSLTVTPLSANSRFLVFVRFAGYWEPTGDARGRVLRNGTQVYVNERVAGNFTSQHESCNDIFLDHPNTTGQVTYVMQGATTGSGTMDFGHAGNACQLMVMEFEG